MTKEELMQLGQKIAEQKATPEEVLAFINELQTNTDAITNYLELNQ